MIGKRKAPERVQKKTPQNGPPKAATAPPRRPKALGGATTPPFPEIGCPVSFYHEGGHGERYWSNGWRYGIIREKPIKGQYKSHYRLEIPVKMYGWNPEKRAYYLREPIKVWVHATKVNPLGDFIYHGPTLREVVDERANKKAADVAALCVVDLGGGGGGSGREAEGKGREAKNGASIPGGRQNGKGQPGGPGRGQPSGGRAVKANQPNPSAGRRRNQKA